MIDRDRTGTAADIALVVTAFSGRPLLASTIRTWVARGELRPVGHDSRHRDLYRLGDVLARADARHAVRGRAARPSS